MKEPITAIGSSIDHHHRQPQPFIWTAKAADILEKVKRARAALDNLHSAGRILESALLRMKRDTVAISAHQEWGFSPSCTRCGRRCPRRSGDWVGPIDRS